MSRGSHLVGLVGAGIDASLSPALHEAEAAAQGLDYEYRLLDIDQLELDLGAIVAQARERGTAGSTSRTRASRTSAHLDDLPRGRRARRRQHRRVRGGRPRGRP